MAALVVIALFWGNCFSCPQILLSLQSHKAAHECCKRGQKPINKGCQNQGMQNFVKSDAASAAAVVPVLSTVAAVELVTPPAQDIAPVIAEAAANAPPDLLSLHASFRI